MHKFYQTVTVLWIVDSIRSIYECCFVIVLVFIKNSHVPLKSELLISHTSCCYTL